MFYRMMRIENINGVPTRTHATLIEKDVDDLMWLMDTPNSLTLIEVVANDEAVELLRQQLNEVEPESKKRYQDFLDEAEAAV